MSLKYRPDGTLVTGMNLAVLDQKQRDFLISLSLSHRFCFIAGSELEQLKAARRQKAQLKTVKKEDQVVFFFLMPTTA